MKERNYSKAMRYRGNNSQKQHKKKKQEKNHEKINLIKYQKEDILIENDTLVGLFQKSRNFGFVVPDDKKILGTDIFISKKDTMKAKNNQKVVVQITKLPTKDKKAEGKIVEILGNVNQAGIDMMSLIREYDLPYEFPQVVLEQARDIKQQVAKTEIKRRLDLRDEEIFTIDGEDAKDLDDAVQVKKQENGTYLLGVHIADVSNYVTEDSFLDREAIIRGTSVYMMDRVIPMLPVELSNGICSLNAGQDRLALSVLMEIDKEGKVISSDIKKSVIHVTERMSYKGVQKILDNYDKKIEEIEDEETRNIVKKYEPYKEHFKSMEELAHILNARREKAGSLNLDIPETKVILDEDGYAVDITKYELTFANEIIEQFMLTANETVAEKFFWLEAPFIYRVHEEPDLEKVSELNKFLFNFGYRVKCTKEAVHSTAFEEVLEKVKGKPEERVVSNLVLRTLKVARYEAENLGHFGIASKYYCHFTSPIRRYPDLFIHRIISKYIEEGYNLSTEEIEKYKSQAEKYAKQSSDREKIAQKVERDSVDVKMAEYMQDKIGNEYDGIVSSITSFGMFVELENTVEGLVRFDDLGNEYFIYDEDRKTLLGEQTKTLYKIGDKIKVRVIRANKQLRQIDFEKVEEEKEKVNRRKFKNMC